MRKILLSSILISLVCFFLSPVTQANAGTLKITNNEFHDSDPQISNNKVVWNKWDGNDWEIFLYDITSGITLQITSNNYFDYGAQIKDGTIVWYGGLENNAEIYSYDITSGITTQVTNNSYHDHSPQINEGKIAWFGSPSFAKVFLYDISTGITTQVSNIDFGDGGGTPQIHDNKVIRSGFDGHDFELFLYDISTGISTQVTNNEINDKYPDISNGHVVWQSGEQFSESTEIYSYELATGLITQLTNNNYPDSSPQISNDNVVWNGNGQTYLYDFTIGTTIQVINNGVGDYPQIDDSKVVLNGWDGNDVEVYLYDIATETVIKLSDNSTNDGSPMTSNGKVVWQVYDGTDSEIFLWDESIPENTTPVIADLQDLTINLGESYTATGSFIDTTSSSWSATVDYGDGSGVYGLTLNGTSFDLSHTYTNADTFTVTVVVTDDGGLFDTETAEVTVINPEPVTLYPTADSYIKQGSSNENEGASSSMRLQSTGHNRSLVKFDQSQIETAVNGAQNYTAKLQFTISDNGNNWGSTGRAIALHRLTQDWTEGNGFNDGNNPSFRGTGNGITWSCATDANIQNTSKNCTGGDEWNMTNSSLWPFASAATATTTITNNQSGVVEFDVTSDVQSYISGANTNTGWLLKKVDEGQNGRVEFGTKESSNTSVLVITFE